MNETNALGRGGLFLITLAALFLLVGWVFLALLFWIMGTIGVGSFAMLKVIEEKQVK